MSSTHSVSDLIARVKNGYLAKRTVISSPVSNLRENILKILKEEGFILNYSKIKTGTIEKFDIHLKYHYQQHLPDASNLLRETAKAIQARNYCV